MQTPTGAFVQPRALAFNPRRAGELWIADSGRDSATILELTGAGGNVSAGNVRAIKDRARYHYMDHVSSIAFDPVGQFATCQESLNSYEVHTRRSASPLHVGTHTCPLSPGTHPPAPAGRVRAGPDAAQLFHGPHALGQPPAANQLEAADMRSGRHLLPDTHRYAA